MSAQVAIVCDECGDVGIVGTAATELRGRLTGWTWRNGLDICPLCRLLADGQRPVPPDEHTVTEPDGWGV